MENKSCSDHRAEALDTLKHLAERHEREARGLRELHRALSLVKMDPCGWQRLNDDLYRDIPF